jgi:ubiquinone biosynthesis protein UbiJ|tara:strand:- start:249 stop:476 length:228 start_codon:yes stop_codon:yes gene_type:complete
MSVNDTIDDMADRLREDLRSMVEKDAAAAARREVWELEGKVEKLEQALESLCKLIEERYSYPGVKLPEECRYERP